MKPNENPDLSIVVPAYKEARNIPLLVEEVVRDLAPVVDAWEMIIVDDDSRDGTAAVCNRLRRDGLPVRLIVRKNARGLATAVLEGFNRAKAPVFVVMDADLSHMPVAIPRLYREVLDGAEFVIGSRYLTGGGTDDKWTVYRYLNSKVASLLARPLAAVSDPMSGFFALPRSLWDRCAGLSPVGYKIGLEIIVKCRPRAIREVPIYFRTRKLGESKLTVKQQYLYLVHLLALYRFKASR